jgi:H+/Cl- antiporter ClcA
MLISMPLYDQLGAWMFLILFTTPSLLCTFYVYHRLPETKGREIDDIVRELMRDTSDVDDDAMKNHVDN